jgi:hypothetical protein
MTPRLYLETIIPSYLTSRPSRDLIVAGHQQVTREWWERRRDAFQPYLSQLLIDEVSAGDPAASRERLRTLRDFPLLDITPKVTDLASSILAAGKILRKAAADAAHIANCSGAWNRFPNDLELRAYCECDKCPFTSPHLPEA